MNAGQVKGAGASIRVELATNDDIDGIMAIEEACFTPPWPRDAMLEEISGRDWSRVYVARMGELIAGFMVYWIVDMERHLLNIATAERWRRSGVAGRLMGLMLQEASHAGAEVIVREVRRTNANAHALYEKLGFRRVGVRPGYYADNGEDAIVMILEVAR